MEIVNVIFALFNLLLAYLVLRETRLLREAETEPEISIYLERTPALKGYYDIIVKNIGQGAAYKLSFDFDHDSEIVQLDPNRKLFELGFFEHGTEYLAPGQQYKTILGGHTLFRKPALKRLEIKVSYQNKSKKQFNDMFYVDPSDYWGTPFVDPKDIGDLCKELTDIRDEVRRVSENINDLKPKTKNKKHHLHL